MVTAQATKMADAADRSAQILANVSFALRVPSAMVMNRVSSMGIAMALGAADAIAPAHHRRLDDGAADPLNFNLTRSNRGVGYTPRPRCLTTHRAFLVIRRYARGMSVSRPLPPDRSHVRTEHRHEHSANLDSLDTRAFVALMANDARTVPEVILGASDVLARFIDDLVPRMQRGGRLIYIGAGTSGRLGVLDASECPPTFQASPEQVVGIIAGGDASLRQSSEGKEDDPHGTAEQFGALKLNDRDTVVGVAAGGTTPFVLGALPIAHDVGAMTALLTCAPVQSIPPKCDHLIVIDTGPELLTGSTRLKAGSATKLALNIISTAAFIQLGKVYSNLMVDLRATNAKLQDRAMRILVALCPELNRERAAALLERAGGQLKTAVVMQRLDLDAIDANDLLTKANDQLRVALEAVSRDSASAD
jgi:N-acetylmuramic acid 6-phosphate etherase